MSKNSIPLLFLFAFLFSPNVASGKKLMTSISIGLFDGPLANFYIARQDCKKSAAQNPRRGEYETRSEYRQRLNRLKGKCSAFDGGKTKLYWPARLRYNADNEYFRFFFDIDSSHGSETIRVKINGTDFVKNDFPRLRKSIPKSANWYRLSERGESKFYKQCLFRNMTFDRSFFFNIHHDRYKIGPPDRRRMCRGTYKWKTEPNRLSGFSVSSLGFRIKSNIQQARALKAREKSLIWVVEGSSRFVKPPRFGGAKIWMYLNANSIQILNTETGKPILRIGK